MKKIGKAGLVMAFWIATCLAAQAQTASRLNDKQVESLLRRLEENADRFRSSFDHALDRSRLSGSKDKDRAKRYVKDFEAATDHLKDRFSKNNSAAGDVEQVLLRAEKIEDLMEQDIPDSRAQNDWQNLRNNLDELAQAYNVTWHWSERPSRSFAPREDDTRLLVGHIEQDTDRFRESLYEALDRGHFDESRREEDRIHFFVQEFETATDRLKDDFYRNDASTTRDVEEVLHRGARIDRFMLHNSLGTRVQDDWGAVRRDLDELAQAYSVRWEW